MKNVARNLEAEVVWGDGAPTDQRMEDMVCEGYFPFLNWEFFRWAYPTIEFSAATEMFLAAMHRAVQRKRLFMMVPPHVTNPRVGSKQMGNIITGQRHDYWEASADEVILYFRAYWPHTDVRGQTLADHQDLNWPLFCFPMSAQEYDPLNQRPEIDWSDYFMFP